MVNGEKVWEQVSNLLGKLKTCRHHSPLTNPHEFIGLTFSGSIPNSLIACSTRCGLISPRLANCESAARTMHSASTSKKRRKEVRFSLRPKPSVPKAYNPPGTQRAI